MSYDIKDPLLGDTTDTFECECQNYFSDVASLSSRTIRSRILDRDATFHQSRGQWGVARLNRSGFSSLRGCCRRFWDHWFYHLVYQRTIVLMFTMFLIYTTVVFFFAFLYLVISLYGPVEGRSENHSSSGNGFCEMDIEHHMDALYFSLSTMSTIGYGVSDYYFGGCWTPLAIVLLQVFCAITFDAVAIGLIFLRISRGQKRGKTVIFSNKAVVRRVRGVPHLMLRIGELRRYCLIEARIRVYCIRHERVPVRQITQDNCGNVTTSMAIETSHFLAHHVDLLWPKASSGSHVVMSLPQVIVHRMDDDSPLTPPKPVWYDADGKTHSVAEFDPPIPGDEGGCEYNLNSDKAELKQSLLRYAMERVDIEHFLHDREAEIVVLVEGIDEMTGAVIQSRHSYKYNELVWDHSLADCIHRRVPKAAQESRPWFASACKKQPTEMVCAIDFSAFHDIIPAPLDCDACPYVPEQKQPSLGGYSREPKI